LSEKLRERPHRLRDKVLARPQLLNSARRIKLSKQRLRPTLS